MKMPGVGVGIIILNEDSKILLLLRDSDNKKADSDMHLEGLYTLPSGKVKYGETLYEAAIRKVKEETGCFIEKEDLEMISISDDMNQYAHFVTIGFVALKYQGKIRLKDSCEFTSYDWFSLNHLPRNLCFPSKVILRHYQEHTIYDKE